jgi:hypothetical protein
MARSAYEESPVGKPKGWPPTLLLAASIYAVWLAWLAYVAWVDISAGNQ